MKKLLAVLFAALTLGASAKLEKVVTVQVADIDGITAALNQLGEHFGNPMLSSMALAAIAQNPLYATFGSSRDGLPLAASVYLDPKIAVAAIQGDEKARKNDDCIEFSVTYATTKTKKDLVDAFGDVVETNGCLRIDSFPVGKYVRFSSDGKWVTCASKPMVIEDGLKDASLAEKKMGGDFFRVFVPAKGVKVALALVLAAEKLPEGSEACKELDGVRETFDFENLRQILAGVASLKGGVRCDKRGLDFRGSMKLVKDSELDRLAFKPIKGRPLAFATAGEVVAMEEGENNGNINRGENLKAVLEAVAKCGIKTDGFKMDKIDGGYRLTVDADATARYLSTDGTNDLVRLDTETYRKTVCDAWKGKDKKFSIVADPSRLGIVIKGTKGAPAADRFEKLLPEAKGKPICEATYYSLSGMLKALIPLAQKFAVPSSQPMVQMLSVQLQSATEGGVADARWREKDVYHSIARVSASELKCFGTILNSFVGQLMMGGMGGGFGGCDDDDDCDEDDGSDE